MKDEIKRIFLIMLALFLLLIALVAVPVLAIGEKETTDFTGTDWLVFRGFLLVELILAVLLLIQAVKLGKLIGSHVPQRKAPAAPSKLEAKRNRISLYLSFLAMALAIGAMLLGASLGKGREEELGKILLPWIIGGICLPPVLTLASWLLKKREERHFRDMDVEEGQRWLLSHRDQADDVAVGKLRLLGSIRRRADGYAYFLAALGVLIAFALGVTGSTTVMTLLPCVLYLAAGLFRLRFPAPNNYYTETNPYVSQEEFPTLYAIAHRAQAAHGLRGNIHIGITHENNAGISIIGGEYSVMLGAVLLGVLNEEELFHVLLHEFAHVGNARVQKEYRFMNWLTADKINGVLSPILDLPFAHLDQRYALEMTLFRFADTIGEETRADAAMMKLGESRTAASALLKLKYVDLFEWEEESEARPLPETAAGQIHDLVSGRIQRAREALSTKRDQYRSLMEKEILSRTASHPTMKMRLDALGVQNYTIKTIHPTKGYLEELERAVTHVERLLRESNSEEEYAASRNKSLSIVQEWEDEGCPLHPEKYPDVVAALRDLGQMEEAMALCDRAIEELREGESRAYALYMTGCCRLHQWDASGLDRIYQAISCNSNYLEEGMNQAGSFCCLSGNQEELDRYRELMPQLLQKEKDVFSQIGVLQKGDRLSAEELPDAMAIRIRQSLQELDQGRFDKVYLLHKQISEDFFTSAMVVRFVPEVKPEDKQETMHRIFLLLDSIDGWQFSLFEDQDVPKVKPEEIPGSLFYPEEK